MKILLDTSHMMYSEATKDLAEKYGIEIIYLFGSQAVEGDTYLKGQDISPDAISDLDIAVLFKEQPIESIKIYGELYKDLANFFEPFDIDLVFMNEMETLFQYEVIKGIRIFEKDMVNVDAFEETIMKKSADLLFKQKRMNREIMEAIEDGYFDFEYRANP